MTTRAPTISVLMPAYRSGRHIARAIQSVLDQDFRDFELVIVLDPAPADAGDETESEIARFNNGRIRLIRRTAKEGLVAALNHGLGEARGTYVARMDADDICKPSRLGQQKMILDQDPAAILTSSWTEVIDDSGQVVRQSRWTFTPEAIYAILYFRNCFAHPSVMLRREVALAEGGYSSALKQAEDYELWCRLSSKGRMIHLPEALLQWRSHEAGLSASHDSEIENVARGIARARSEELLGAAIPPEVFGCMVEKAELAALPREGCELLAGILPKVLGGIIGRCPPFLDQRKLCAFLSVEFFKYQYLLHRRGVLMLPPEGLAQGGGLEARALGAAYAVADRYPRLRLRKFLSLPQSHF